MRFARGGAHRQDGSVRFKGHALGYHLDVPAPSLGASGGAAVQDGQHHGGGGGSIRALAGRGGPSGGGEQRENDDDDDDEGQRPPLHVRPVNDVPQLII